MFTGIIEELGMVRSIEGGREGARLTIEARGILADIRRGDSVAVNGVCLTVTEHTERTFAVDVMAETLAKTNLGRLRRGARVNLERALRLGDRLGGHLVTGHVDGVGTIVGRERQGIATVFAVRAPQEVARYLIPKGSVAVDGISLTVVDVIRDIFTVSIIPHTAALTTLGFKQPGDTVNLEADVVGKYVARLFRREEGEQGITLDFLARTGFLES
ncbi:MAG: riboflavin synthase [Desulfotomaculales bacterium]